MSKYVYGIDLGTTYSCIAYQDDTGRPVVIKNSEGTNTTPSVVQFSEDVNEVIVGQVAKDTAVLYPKNTISFIKTKMGKEAEVPYGDNSNKTISPVEVSSYILKKVCQDATTNMDDEVKDVVITCPAYFGEAERIATKQAGIAAGLNVLSIIDEPTAAAVYYGCSRDADNKTVLVYDLGGGTFDISVITVKDGRIDVICTDGDHDLGGKDWDTAVMRHVAEKFEHETGYNGEYDEEEQQDLAIKVERAKQQLTQKEKTTFSMNVQGFRAGIELTREKFDDVTKTLLDTTIDLTKRVMSLATDKYGVVNFDELLLVGGSTKMPQVTKAIKEEIGIEPKILEPDEAVAKGAAIYAMVKEYMNQKEAKEEQLGNQNQEVEEEKLSILPMNMDIEKIEAEGVIGTKSSKSFGIKVINKNREEQISNIILKNSKTPCTITKVFGTAEDNQENVAIEVYESAILEEYYDVDEDYKIGDAILELPMGLLAGSGIEVTLNLSDEGTLFLTGKELSKNREVSATFKSDCIMTDEEVQAIVSNVTSMVVI